MSNAGDWTEIIKAIFEPHEYIKRRCPIDQLFMERTGDTYRCPNGHAFTKGMSKPDHMLNDGDFHGDL